MRAFVIVQTHPHYWVKISLVNVLRANYKNINSTKKEYNLLFVAPKFMATSRLQSKKQRILCPKLNLPWMTDRQTDSPLQRAPWTRNSWTHSLTKQFRALWSTERKNGLMAPPPREHAHDQRHRRRKPRRTFNEGCWDRGHYASSRIVAKSRAWREHRRINLSIPASPYAVVSHLFLDYLGLVGRSWSPPPPRIPFARLRPRVLDLCAPNNSMFLRSCGIDVLWRWRSTGAQGLGS